MMSSLIKVGNFKNGLKDTLVAAKNYQNPFKNLLSVLFQCPKKTNERNQMFLFVLVRTERRNGKDRGPPSTGAFFPHAQRFLPTPSSPSWVISPYSVPALFPGWCQPLSFLKGPSRQRGRFEFRMLGLLGEVGRFYLQPQPSRQPKSPFLFPS